MDTTQAYQKLVAEYRDLSQHAPEGVAAGKRQEYSRARESSP